MGFFNLTLVLRLVRTFSGIHFKAAYNLVFPFFAALFSILINQSLELFTPSNHRVLLLIHCALTAHFIF